MATISASCRHKRGEYMHFPWQKQKQEQRAEEGKVTFDDGLLAALLGGQRATKEMALQVPTVSGGIDLIAGVIAGTPIKLYHDEGGRKAKEVTGDPRLVLLNDDTGDTLNANDFWRAMVRDYYTGKGGFAYIRREYGKAAGLYYVDETQISIAKNADPIFKDFDIMVQGIRYHPFEFLRILRNTRDGMTGVPLTAENSKLIETSYAALILERNMAKRGGNKKGFLKAERKLDKASLDELRAAFKNLYGADNENFIVLNNGIDFKESSNTSAEMQLNENKLTNAGEFSKLFHVPAQVIAGTATAADTASIAKLAAIPLMNAIQCSLNRDLLLEREKGSYYFAFDTKELLRGDMAERFNAYKTALDGNFMQIDEVRYAEDMEPLGLTWIKLGLQDVLYDPKTKQIFTPNTGRGTRMDENAPDPPQQEEQGSEEPLPQPDSDATIEQRAGGQRRDSKGRFAGGGGGGIRRKRGGPKYAPSPQRNTGGIKLGPKTYAKLCGTFNTRYPGLKPEDGARVIRDAAYSYKASADGNGGMTVHHKTKITEKG